jgi:single-stranded DNA-binding protein
MPSLTVEVAEYEPELRYTPTGQPVIVFEIAMPGTDNPIQAEAWGDKAEEICDMSLSVGDMVCVQGYTKLRTWTDRDGVVHERSVFQVKSLVKG